ncbi:MAG: hypothetical protein IPP12_22560 [Nitrospira sp.]|nr:hypothetical protein [Nitrospira sp.]
MTPMLVDPKDPNATNRFGWDVSDHCVASNTTLTGATITEVDCSDISVTTPTVTITQQSFTSAGVVTALVSGGTPGSSVYLRCRYTMANGEGDDRTIKVLILHQ